VLYKDRIPHPTSVDLIEPYEVMEIELPEWLTTETYCAQYERWGTLWACGADPEWPESWQRLLSILNNDHAARVACIDLLKVKKFRSEFRRSLKDRLVTWLEDPEERYPSPFTPKQWNKILLKWVVWKADRIQRGILMKPLPLGVPKLVRSRVPKRTIDHGNLEV